MSIYLAGTCSVTSSVGGNVKHLSTSISEYLGAVITSNNLIEVIFKVFLLPQTIQVHSLLLVLMNQ